MYEIEELTLVKLQVYFEKFRSSAEWNFKYSGKELESLGNEMERLVKVANFPGKPLYIQTALLQIAAIALIGYENSKAKQSV